jgi:predicted methyltransferase
MAAATEEPLVRIVVLAAAGLVLAAAASASFASDVALKPTQAQLAAVSDANRPKEDIQRDAERKPADMLAFAGVKPGDKVADLIPGKGYFTRLFADVVGPKGVVYAYEPSEFAKFSKSPLPANGAHPDPARPNIVFLTGPVNDFATPQKLDIVWTSQNYHDLKDSFTAPADTARVNKAVFAALKPGGVYIVLDHVALPGTPNVTETLHRIDPAIVRKEVEAAGFVFDGETDVLRNPADPHDIKVFDPSIRGRTDQFVYRFRKPKS